MGNIIVSCLLAEALLLPIARKWELEYRPVAVWAIFAGIGAGMSSDLLAGRFGMPGPAIIAVDAVMILILSGAALLIRFYRDDPRRVPRDRDIVVSPADGVIKYIKEITATDAPFSEKGKEKALLGPPLLNIAAGGGYLIGIAMSFLDVHITRAPITGHLTYFEHVKGSFLSLKNPEAPYRNERVIEVIQGRDRAVGIIQIASRLVRRIVAYTGRGDLVGLGQKIGMIRFGSQVDLVLPADDGLSLQIREGERVYAGCSIIARTRSSAFSVRRSELKNSDPLLQGALETERVSPSVRQ